MREGSIGLPATPADHVPARLDTWERAVAAYLRGRVKSPHTERAYSRWLLPAGDMMGIATVAQLTGERLTIYRQEVIDLEVGPASHDQAIAAMRSFLRWTYAVRLHQIPRDIYGELLESTGAEVQRPYSVLTDAEIVAMTRAARSKRDRALLAVMVGAGLRVSEVVRLEAHRVLTDQAGGAAIYVSQGKGRKDRTVPIQPDTLAIVGKYLAVTGRSLGRPGPLFRAHDRDGRGRGVHGMSESAVWLVVRDCAARARITAKSISPHSLRHTFAIRFLRGGGNVVALQKLLGHASLATTQRYLDHLDLAEIRSMMPALPKGVS